MSRSRLRQTFDAAREERRGIFMPFVVIGDPDMPTSLRVVDAILSADPDVLEFGLAFSDPPADGPVIQAADQRALRAGATVEQAFSFLETVRARTEKPIALLLYFNLILNYGVERFYERASACGVDAVLVADLPIEEAAEAVAAAARHGIAPVFIVSELTTKKRLAAIAEKAGGYLYLVARLGVTGTQAQFGEGLGSVIERLREGTSLPILVGFGISKPEHVQAALDAGADGAISGSAIVRRIEENLADTDRMLREVTAFCRLLKEATK